MTGKEKPQSEERGSQDLQCWTQARYLEGAKSKMCAVYQKTIKATPHIVFINRRSCLAPAFNAVGFAWDNKSNPTQSQIGPTPRPLSWSAIGAVRRLLATKGQPSTAFMASYHKAGKGGSYDNRMEKMMALALVQQTIGINQEYFQEWLDYREHDLKKPMTPRAISMLKRKLLQYSEAEQERLICHAIEHNWRGIYYVEPPRQATTRQNTLEHDLTDTSWARQ